MDIEQPRITGSLPISESNVNPKLENKTISDST